MPLGLCNAPATFQRLMGAVPVGIARERSMVYLDDVLVIVRDFQEHLSNLKEVLDLLCAVLFWQQTGLGYIVSTDGISAIM